MAARLPRRFAVARSGGDLRAPPPPASGALPGRDARRRRGRHHPGRLRRPPRLALPRRRRTRARASRHRTRTRRGGRAAPAPARLPQGEPPDRGREPRRRRVLRATRLAHRGSRQHGEGARRRGGASAWRDRDRRLPATGRRRLARAARAGPALRPRGRALGLVHGPPLPPRSARGSFVRGVDDGDRAGHGHRAHPARTPRAGERIPPPGPAGEDGDHPRPRQRRPARPRSRQRIVPGGVRAVRARAPARTRPRRAARRGAAGAQAALLRRGADVPGTTLPARRRAQRATPAATPASSDPRRRRGRAPHPADRGASRRRLELPDVRARGAAAQARSAADRVRGHRTRPGIAPRHRGGGARARAARGSGGRGARRGAAPLPGPPASRRGAGAERRR